MTAPTSRRHHRSRVAAQRRGNRRHHRRRLFPARREELDKGQRFPVSEADIVLDNYLRQALCAARPDYGWLSESADDNSRLSHRRSFVVDPIDGTRGFIRGEDSWSISLAVIEDGIAVAGVVYARRVTSFTMPRLAPARGRTASLGAQAPGRPAGAADPRPGAVHQELQAEGLHYARGPAYPSLAYRLVQVATGKLDAAVARRGALDWDVAGAACILTEAGIGFEDVCMGPLRFNRPEIRHGALAAVADASLRPVLHRALIRIYGCPQSTDIELERHGQ